MTAAASSTRGRPRKAYSAEWEFIALIHYDGLQDVSSRAGARDSLTCCGADEADSFFGDQGGRPCLACAYRYFGSRRPPRRWRSPTLPAHRRERSRVSTVPGATIPISSCAPGIPPRALRAASATGAAVYGVSHIRGQSRREQPAG